MTLREKVARVLWERVPNAVEWEADEYLPSADAAIAAVFDALEQPSEEAQAAGVSEVMDIVNTVVAGIRTLSLPDEGPECAVWRAMLAAERKRHEGEKG